MSVLMFNSQAQQVQPAVSQVQPAVSQAPAAPAASHLYNQPLTTATTHSSSQVPAHYSQGYPGYQQGTLHYSQGYPGYQQGMCSSGQIKNVMYYRKKNMPLFLFISKSGLFWPPDKSFNRITQTCYEIVSIIELLAFFLSSNCKIWYVCFDHQLCNLMCSLSDI